MDTVKLNAWSEFPEAISKIRNDFGTRSVPKPGGDHVLLKNDILFRGHADSDWKLETTLERSAEEPYTVGRYLQRANSCVNEVESLTGKKWNLKTYPEILEEHKSHSTHTNVHLPHYDYLVYLRHHGFPSPLLDWTTSPYIAAYFAFEQPNNADRCAVYAFIEAPMGHKPGRGSDDTVIRTMGPYVTTHIRHFTQRAVYSVCSSWNEHDNEYTFCPHHEVTPSGFAGVKQDVLIRITIPRQDRLVALQQLQDYNINHYTLFQTEDALIRTMAMRAFEMNGK